MRALDDQKTAISVESLALVAAELTDLRRTLNLISAAIGEIVSTQGMQNSLMRAVLEAITDSSGDGEAEALAATLGRLAESLDTQRKMLSAMRSSIDAIPRATAAALKNS